MRVLGGRARGLSGVRLLGGARMFSMPGLRLSGVSVCGECRTSGTARARRECIIPYICKHLFGVVCGGEEMGFAVTLTIPQVQGSHCEQCSYMLSAQYVCVCLRLLRQAETFKSLSGANNLHQRPRSM